MLHISLKITVKLQESLFKAWEMKAYFLQIKVNIILFYNFNLI